MTDSTTIQAAFQVSATNGPVRLTLLPEDLRFSLRMDASGLAAASKALGTAIPHTIGQMNKSDGRSVLCLGPDEWEIQASETDRGDITALFASIYPTVPHSLTDVSDREIAIELEGDGAAELLSVGCPIDFSEMEPGSGKRSIFDNAQVIIRRDTEARFQMQVWRSFLPHAWGLLNVANREFASGL